MGREVRKEETFRAMGRKCERGEGGAVRGDRREVIGARLYFREGKISEKRGVR